MNYTFVKSPVGQLLLAGERGKLMHLGASVEESAQNWAGLQLSEQRGAASTAIAIAFANDEPLGADIKADSRSEEGGH